MGAYVLVVKLAPQGQPEPDDWKPFYRHFQLKDEHVRAKVNPTRRPDEILDAIFRTGQKQKFC